MVPNDRHSRPDVPSPASATLRLSWTEPVHALHQAAQGTKMKDWLKSLLLPDQRKASRKKTPPLVAYFWDGGRPVAHNVRDISSTGFYLTTEERWLLGTLVMITLQRTKTEADRPDCSVIVMAKVVHHGDDGVGFTFLPVDSATPGQRPRPGFHAADRKTLERFLQRLASDRS